MARLAFIHDIVVRAINGVRIGALGEILKRISESSYFPSAASSPNPNTTHTRTHTRENAENMRAPHRHKRGRTHKHAKWKILLPSSRCTGRFRVSSLLVRSFVAPLRHNGISLSDFISRVYTIARAFDLIRIVRI